jgi:uncharacterized cupin superfamily protein
MDRSGTIIMAIFLFNNRGSVNRYVNQISRIKRQNKKDRAMLVRIYTGSDEQSHFEDLEMPTQDVHRVTTKPGEDLVFRTTPGDRVAEWHNPTRRQYLIVIQGKMEVSVADGTTRQFQAGDVLLAEDMSGQGHLTKPVDGPYTSLSMGIPDL